MLRPGHFLGETMYQIWTVLDRETGQIVFYRDNLAPFISFQTPGMPGGDELAGKLFRPADVPPPPIPITKPKPPSP